MIVYIPYYHKDYDDTDIIMMLSTVIISVMSSLISQDESILVACDKSFNTFKPEKFLLF